jgi:hypothetical protein
MAGDVGGADDPRSRSPGFGWSGCRCVRDGDGSGASALRRRLESPISIHDLAVEQGDHVLVAGRLAAQARRRSRIGDAGRRLLTTQWERSNPAERRSAECWSADLEDGPRCGGTRPIAVASEWQFCGGKAALSATRFSCACRQITAAEREPSTYPVPSSPAGCSSPCCHRPSSTSATVISQRARL